MSADIVKYIFPEFVFFLTLKKTTIYLLISLDLYDGRGDRIVSASEIKLFTNVTLINSTYLLQTTT